ncbi:MAG TPA: hypothetical protein VE801_08410 [Xanthobacteraceae bacterium]|jgi:hypothetical protein|nr:hypothetical protein [Xanthobacteraceae bacterium]
MTAAAVPSIGHAGLVPGIHAFVLQSKTWMAAFTRVFDALLPGHDGG